MKKYNLINIQTAPSRNGYSLKATLTIDGLDACTIQDDGDGSEPIFRTINLDLYTQLKKDISLLPPVYVKAYDMEMKIDVGLFIDILHLAIVNKTEFNLLNN